jgi:hypothetical protein
MNVGLPKITTMDRPRQRVLYLHHTKDKVVVFADLYGNHWDLVQPKSAKPQVADPH